MAGQVDPVHPGETRSAVFAAGEQTSATDAAMMRRCIALACSAHARGEVPYAAVISRRGRFVCEQLNMANADHDVTHHAELISISTAQKQLGSSSLEDCTLYSLVEPCPMCAYALREVRIGRVVYGLGSPVMGGHSRWNILGDEGLSQHMPEVFAGPPEIVAGFLGSEAASAMRAWNPLFWSIIRERDLITAGDEPRIAEAPAHIGSGPSPSRPASWLRWAVDRLWRN
jgi:tRNA(adenine34) deaminase